MQPLTNNNSRLILLRDLFLLPFLKALSLACFVIILFDFRISFAPPLITSALAVIAPFVVLCLWLQKETKEHLLRTGIISAAKHLFLGGLSLLLAMRAVNALFFANTLNIPPFVSLMVTVSTILTAMIALLFIEENTALSDVVHPESLTSIRSKLNPVSLLRRWKRQDGLLIVLSALILIIIGFSIRLYKLGHLSLWWDELYTGTYVARILEKGIPSFASEIGFYWRGVAYHYLVSAFAALFGKTEFWLRFPSVLFGMGIVILAYSFARKIHKVLALLVLVFMVFSTFNIEYSRFARFYIMNAFLFLLAIPIFYRGFILQKKAFKITSVGIFVLMIHTVQLSSIFLSLVAVYGLYFIKQNIVNIRQPLLILKNNLFDFFCILSIVVIYAINNVFERFFQPDAPYAKALDLGLTEEPRQWSTFALPEWKSFEFFDQSYIPLILMILAVVLIVTLFLKTDKHHRFFAFLGLTTYVSIVLYEIGSRGVYGPRIYLFDDALVVITALCSLYIILDRVLQKKRTALVYTGITTLLLIASIHPTFVKRISIEYGDDTTTDAFRTTSVAAFRSDYKTTEEFVAERIKKEDTLINVVNVNYFYLERSPDYVVNQNVRWNTNALLADDGSYIIPSSKSVLINSAYELENIIARKKGGTVWLIVNGGSLRILGTTHVRTDFIDFLNKYSNRVVYTSPDNASRVLMF